MTCRLFAALALVAWATPIALAGAAAAPDQAGAADGQGADRAALAQAQREVLDAILAVEPWELRSRNAEEAIEEARYEVEGLREELTSRRTEALERIERYEDEQSAHDATTAGGLALAGLAVLGAVGVFAFGRARGRSLSRRRTQAVAAGLGVALVAGLCLAFVPSSPERPELSPVEERLAAAEEPSSKELVEAEARLRRSIAALRPLAKLRSEGKAVVAEARSEVRAIRARLDQGGG